MTKILIYTQMYIYTHVHIHTCTYIYICTYMYILRVAFAAAEAANTIRTWIMKWKMVGMEIRHSLSRYGVDKNAFLDCLKRRPRKKKKKKKKKKKNAVHRSTGKP